MIGFMENTQAANSRDSDLKEVQRLQFVLDKANRFPNLLSTEEMLKLSRKLAELERKVYSYKK